MWENIEALGWFWGTIRTIIREKPRATIAEVLGEGEADQCTVPQCGQIFANERGIETHFTGYNGALLQKDWTAQRCKLIHRFELVGEGEVNADTDMMERREGGVDVRMGMREGGMEENAEGEIPEEERHGPSMQARQERLHLRIEAGRIVQRDEEEQAAVDREGRRRRFIKNRDEYLRQMERVVDIPRLNKEQMPRIKTRLEDFFKYEINPLMTELQPDPGDWDGWCAFEGAYEESTHKIRIRILPALNRDTRKLYGVQQVNARLQAVREQRSEQVINHQLIRRTLSKMKNVLEELTEGDGEGAERDREGDEEDAERRRKPTKLTRQVGAVLDLITEDTIKNVFGTQDRREIWNELNTSVDHRRRVIDWLDAMIST
jgi:hypothetical protein